VNGPKSENSNISALFLLVLATKPQAQWVSDEEIWLDLEEIGKHLIIELPVRGLGNEQFTVTYCGPVKDFKALQQFGLDEQDAMVRPAHYVEGSMELWVFVWVYWIDRPW
jgi:hypothetical protein